MYDEVFYNCTQTYENYAYFSYFSNYSLINNFCSLIAWLSLFKFDWSSIEFSNVIILIIKKNIFKILKVLLSLFSKMNSLFSQFSQLFRLIFGTVILEVIVVSKSVIDSFLNFLIYIFCLYYLLCSKENILHEVINKL